MPPRCLPARSIVVLHFIDATRCDAWLACPSPAWPRSRTASGWQATSDSKRYRVSLCAREQPVRIGRFQTWAFCRTCRPSTAHRCARPPCRWRAECPPTGTACQAHPRSRVLIGTGVGSSRACASTCPASGSCRSQRSAGRCRRGLASCRCLQPDPDAPARRALAIHLAGRLVGPCGLWAGPASARWSDQQLALLRSLSLPVGDPGAERAGAALALPEPSNRLADDPAAVAPGARLFVDLRFSANGGLSCASCHRADLAYTDGRGRAGHRAVSRNTPTPPARRRRPGFTGTADATRSGHRR
ncbi:MAG: cytochrome c peroxidase [Burkholderiaceae bacterium]